jgi:hypothetical protein
VVRARGIGIERKLEVLLPVERGPRLGQLIVAVARAGSVSIVTSLRMVVAVRMRHGWQGGVAAVVNRPLRRDLLW